MVSVGFLGVQIDRRLVQLEENGPLPNPEVMITKHESAVIYVHVSDL